MPLDLQPVKPTPALDLRPEGAASQRRAAPGLDLRPVQRLTQPFKLNPLEATQLEALEHPGSTPGPRPEAMDDTFLAALATSEAAEIDPQKPMTAVLAPLTFAGNWARAAASDLGASVSGHPEYGGNLVALANNEPLPADEIIHEITQEHPKTATVAKIGQGTAATLPYLALGQPEGVAGKLMAAGFSADMIKNARDAAGILGTEMGKNPEDRDKDKITDALATLAQATVFAPAAGKHAMGDTVEARIAPKQYVIRKLAKQLATAPVDFERWKETRPATVARVQMGPGTGTVPEPAGGGSATSEQPALQGGESNAITQRKEPGDVQTERPGNVQGGTPAEAGAGGGVPPKAVVESPRPSIGPPAAETQGKQAHEPGDEAALQLLERLRPAIQMPTGPPLVAAERGLTHADVLRAAKIDPDSIPHEDPRRGFVDLATGQWYTRKEAEAATKVKGTAAAGGLDSQDLPGPEARGKPPVQTSGPATLEALKAKAAAVKAGTAPAGNAPPVKSVEVNDEQARQDRAYRQQLAEREAAAAAAAGNAAGAAAPTSYRPPRAEPVAPVLEEDRYRLPQAIADAGGLAAPPLDEALKAIRSGKTPARVVADWTNGGEADALGNILEEIHEAQQSGDAARYRALRKAYTTAFGNTTAGGSDAVLEGLRAMAEEGHFGEAPADTSELYERAWDAAKNGPPVDREATAAAQAAADLEVFSQSLRVQRAAAGPADGSASRTGEPRPVYSGDTKLGDVVTTKRGTTVFVPTAEGENLPPEYQDAVLAKAGISSRSLAEPVPGGTASEYTGMGAAVPGEFLPTESFVTSTKNAVTDQERLKRGLPAAMATARRSFGKVWDEAMALIERAPEVPEQVIEELSHFPRAVNDLENALLLHRQISLQNEYGKVTQLQQQAADDAKQFPTRAADAEELKLRAAKLSDDLLQLYDINKFVGTETARGLASRRMLATETYSLAQMELAKRSANDGQGLTEDQKGEIQRLHDIIEQTQKEFDEYIEWSRQQLSERNATEATTEIVKQVKAQPPAKEDLDTAAGVDLQARVTAGLKTARKSGRSLPDLARYIQKLCEAFIRQGVTERDPLIDAVHEVLKREINPNITRRETMDAISGYGDFHGLNPDAVKAKLRDLRGQMQQVAKLSDIEAKRPLLKTGVERRAPSDEERRLIQQVNEAKRRFGVVTTDPAKQLKGALDAVKTRLKNQIADLDYQISTRAKIIKQKTGVQYDAEANVLKARRDELQKQYDEVFPKAPMTDAQRVQIATRGVERSIELLTAKINAGELSAKRGGPQAPTTPALEALRARRDALRDELDELRGADTAVQAQRDLAGLKRSVAELQRRLDTNDILEQQTAPVEKAETLETKMFRAKRDMLREQLQKLRDAAPETIAAREQSAVDALNASIAELERRINEGDIANRGLSALQVTSPAIEALRGERADLQKVLRQLQAAGRPKKSPEEIALQALKTRLRNATASYQERLAAGDFGPRVRQEIKLDEEAQQLKAANQKAKDAFQHGLILDRLNKRKWYEKMADTFVKWRRGFLLSGPVTLAKLTSAAIQRLAITPVEEVIGGVYSLALPKLAERAPREGGWNTNAEAKAITEATTRAMADAAKYLREGKTPLDVLYGRRREQAVNESDVEPASVIDFFGRLHGALKAPVKRAEFSRSFEKRIAWNLRQGVDVSDPLVQTRIAVEAYKDAQRSIFLQDNRLVSAYKRALTAFEQTNKATGKAPMSGKAAATAARVLLPIVRVPTNIVAETFQYAGGLLSGNAKLALALRQGMDTLAPEEADQILRHLKKGTLGAALMALGYFAPNVVGGYYQPGQKRSAKDVPAGDVRLYGVNVPSWLLHNPLLETLQIGATIRRVADSKVRKKDEQTQGVPAGLVAGGLGLTEEVPFVREQMEVAKAFDQSERAAFFGELLKSLTVPELAQWAATTTDRTPAGPTTARQPSTVWQHVETGIPGLRERVPERIAPDVTTVAGYLMRTGRVAGGARIQHLPAAQRERIKTAITNRLQQRVDSGEDLSGAALAVKIEDLTPADAVAAWKAADEATRQKFAPLLRIKINREVNGGRLDPATARKLWAAVAPFYKTTAAAPAAGGTVLEKY